MDPLDLTGRRVAHLCVDMQKMFSEDTPWRTPWMDRVLPIAAEIAERHAPDTIFTRFIPPPSPEQARGAWKTYFDRWADFTTERLDPELMDLVEPLGRFTPPATILDKPAYSPFWGTELHAQLRARGVDTLAITGAETDVCVLSAVLSAVDHGYFVILPKDALCSSTDETHDALMKLYAKRFSAQVTLTDSRTLLDAWASSLILEHIGR